MIVLIDDMGFGVPSTFGGPVRCRRWIASRKTGLRYNNFHTTALCSPTRAALKSGRNHHVNNMGSITETVDGVPRANRPDSEPRRAGAEMLRLQRLQHRRIRQVARAGPGRRAFPGRSTAGRRRRGFDKFYGFLGGETNQWAPLLYDGVTRVDLPKIRTTTS